MTLGQNIQFLRKNAGMSQEALGEALGVSRQAVSKWESDAAIPELDTLIALSRMFGITVGQLLQIEESYPPASEAAEPEQNDNTIENILKEYSEIKHREDRKNNIYVLSAALILVLAVVVISKLYISSLESDIKQLRSEISSLRSSIQWQINDLNSWVNSAINEESYDNDDVFVERDCSPVMVDVSKGMLTYKLSAVPKTYIEGSTAVFSITYSDATGTRSVESEQVNGPRFETELTIPYCDSAQAMVSFIQPDGTTRNEPLQEIYNARKEYYEIQLNSSCGISRTSSSGKNIKITISGSMEIFVPQYGGSWFDLSVHNVGVSIYKNGKLFKTPELIKIDNRNEYAHSADEYVDVEEAPAEVVTAFSDDIEALYYAIKDPIVIEDAAVGDVYMITAHVIDNHGRRIESTGHNGYYKIVEKESFLGIEMLTDE